MDQRPGPCAALQRVARIWTRGRPRGGPLRLPLPTKLALAPGPPATRWLTLGKNAPGLLWFTVHLGPLGQELGPVLDAYQGDGDTLLLPCPSHESRRGRTRLPPQDPPLGAGQWAEQSSNARLSQAPRWQEGRGHTPGQQPPSTS